MTKRNVVNALDTQECRKILSHKAVVNSPNVFYVLEIIGSHVLGCKSLLQKCHGVRKACGYQLID